jgi:tetratricopeptide (TPR) repeat protein
MAISPPSGATEVPASPDGLPDIPRELIVAGATGHLVVLVGAGASFKSGLPLWKDLILQLFQRALENDSLSADQRRALTEVRDADGDLLVKASFLRNEMGAGWLAAAVASVLRASPSSPTEMHRALAEIPDAVFATTNYDPLLEAALADREGRLPKVVLPSDLEGIRDLAPGQVLKLHGDLDHPETIVLSIKDYIRVGHSIRPAWKERLKAWLQPPSQILLVGYSFSDVDLQEVLSQLQSAYDGTLSGPFWLERRGHLEGAKAKDYDLRPIWLSDYPHAAPWLRKLARAIDEEKARSRSPAPAVAKAVAYAEYVNDKLKARTAEAAKLFNEQRYEDARAIYEEVLHDAEALAAKAPEEGALRRIIAGSRLNTGCCLLCQQQSEAALDVLRRVADHDVEHLSPEGRASLASGLAQRGDIARARAVLPEGDASTSWKGVSLKGSG